MLMRNLAETHNGNDSGDNGSEPGRLEPADAETTPEPESEPSA